MTNPSGKWKATPPPPARQSFGFTGNAPGLSWPQPGCRVFLKVYAPGERGADEGRPPTPHRPRSWRVKPPARVAPFFERFPAIADMGRPRRIPKLRLYRQDQGLQAKAGAGRCRCVTDA